MALERPRHQLKENKRASSFSHILLFDTETCQDYPEPNRMRHNLRLGVGIYVDMRNKSRKLTRDVFTFKTCDEFWDKVISLAHPKKPLYIVAHNIMFDIQVLGRFKRLRDASFKCSTYIEDQQRVLIRFDNGNRSLIFMDNMNYFSGSLDKLGKSIGLNKKEVDFNNVDDATLEDYCKRDVEIMEQAWIYLRKFILEHDLGYQRMTIASTAFHAYRHRFMNYPIYIHDNEFANNLEREAYYGGRSEPFRIGEFRNQHFYKLDVNSMYPYVMKNFNFPNNFISCMRHPTMDDLDRLMGRFYVVARVRLNTSEPVYPKRYKDKLIFPIGRFVTTLNQPELERAMERGQIEDVEALSYYTAYPIFSDYVDFFYNKRMEYKENGNTAFELMSKTMLNSLYGKFGQKVRQWEQIGEADEDIWEQYTEVDAETGATYSVRVHDGMVERSIGFKDGNDTFPGIAGGVTAYARLTLWKYFEIAGLENIFYCDTDGFITNQEGYDRLKPYIDKTRLGYLKVEGKGDYLKITRAKQYQLDNEVKIKGVRKGAVQVGKNLYEQWNKLSRNSKDFNKYIYNCIWERQTKELSEANDKSVTLPNGQCKPLIFYSDDLGEGLDVPEMETEYGCDAVYNGKELMPLCTYKQPEAVSKIKAKRRAKMENKRDSEVGAFTPPH